MENDSPEKYVKVAEKFYWVSLQCLLGHPSGHDLPLTLLQKQAGHALFNALSLQNTDVINIINILYI